MPAAANRNSRFIASAGKYVLHTVHGRRSTEGMDAAGVPPFAWIAVHDAIRFSGEPAVER